MWAAGFLRVFYILFMFVAAPKIGVANTLVWVFLGQILFASILDRLDCLVWRSEASIG